MKLDDLYKNKLVKKIVDDNADIITRELDTDTKSKKEKPRQRLSSKERFVIEAFRLMSEILSKLDVTGYFLVFLNSYPKRRLWEKTFSRSDYLKYHTESYLNNVAGVFDRYLLFVNFLYNLGLQEKHVKYELIKSNEHIKNEPIKRILEVSIMLLERTNIKSLRNRTQHRERFSDKDLDKISRRELVIRSGIRLTQKKRNMLEVAVKILIKFYIGEKKKMAKTINENIVALSDKFFKSLFDKYEERLKSFN